MTIASRVDLARCTPAQLWSALDPELRVLAARALYAHDWGEMPTRQEADATIMQAMRFRESAVRQLPVERRVQYLARSVRPGDSLAGSLLLALHLESRREMLGAFLDALGIRHENGLIAADHDPKPPGRAALTKAVAALDGRFPTDEVETYLASLYVLDRETWAALGEILAARSLSASR